jgi:Na+-translocating ferredoxin:NAD+ oxidoreductase RnfG subunit
MNLLKKTTATIALVALVSGIFSTGVSANSTSQIEAANALANSGYINNHSDNSTAYNLNQNVLRQEIAAVARGISGLAKKTTCNNVFTDVSATTPNTWACASIEALADAKMVSTKNAKFLVLIHFD